MKTRIALYSIILTMILSIASCGDDGKETEIVTPEYLKVSRASNQSKDGVLTGTINITANCDWTITDTKEWLELDRYSGHGDREIAFRCPAHQSDIIRKDTVTVVSAGGSLRPFVVITQYSTIEKLETDVSHLSFAAAGETRQLVIISNNQWQIIGKESWLQFEAMEGEGTQALYVTASENTADTDRTGQIIIKGMFDKIVKVEVTQRGKNTAITLSPNEIHVSALGGFSSISVEGEATWQATANADWLTIDKSSGAGSDIINLTINSNTDQSPRNGNIVVTAGARQYICKVVQDGASLPRITSSSVQLTDGRISLTATVVSEFSIIGCGLCYSTTNNTPSLADGKVDTTISTDGTLRADVLSPYSGATYYIRAFATSDVGTVYGQTHAVNVPASGIPAEGDNVLPNPK